MSNTCSHSKHLCDQNFGAAYLHMKRHAVMIPEEICQSAVRGSTDAAANKGFILNPDGMSKWKEWMLQFMKDGSADALGFKKSDGP